MIRKISPLVVVMFVVWLSACSKGTSPSTTSAATTTTPQAMNTPPPQPATQQGPPPEAHYSPNCAGCVQIPESDSFVIIKAQRAMMSLQTEWQEKVKAFNESPAAKEWNEQVKQMNDKFAAQQKVISDKLEALRKDKKVPANYTFDYQNLQFVPATAATKPPAPAK